MCRDFHCLPSQLMEEDAELLRMLRLVQLGKREEVEHVE